MVLWGSRMASIDWHRNQDSLDLILVPSHTLNRSVSHLSDAQIWLRVHCLCFFMCAVWPYLQSTCMCVQVCTFISRRCYFIEMSPINILPLPDNAQLNGFMYSYLTLLILFIKYVNSYGFFSSAKSFVNCVNCTVILDCVVVC